MKILNNIKIKNFYMSFIILFTILPSLIAMLIAYKSTKQTIKNNYTHNYLENTFNEIENSLSVISSQLTDYTLQFLGYNDIKKIFLNTSVSYEEKVNVLTPYFNTLLENNDYIESIDFVFPNGYQHSFYRNKSVSHTLEADYLANLSNRKFSITPITNQNLLYYAFGKQLYSYNNSYVFGNIIFYIKGTTLTSLISTNSSDIIFFISGDEKIITHTNVNHIGATLYLPEILLDKKNNTPISSKGYTISKFPIKAPSIQNKLTITGIISDAVLSSQMNIILILLFALLFITSFISIFLAAILSRKLTRRIKNLQWQMKQYIMCYENFTPITPSNEIASLEISFNTLTKEISNLISQIKDEKEKQVRAEITALQSQINPHFIYNALDTISWKAKANRQYEIDDMLVTLATFFRTGLHSGDEIISIADEISHVNSYLTIEKIRFPELFEVQYDIDPEIMNYQTVKIILQPLVENSIKHGFKTLKNRKGLLKISGRKDNDTIIFKILDNGCGLTRNPLEHKSRSYGVRNINQRLCLYYGNDYCLSYSDNPDGCGTLVTVRIKAISIDN